MSRLGYIASLDPVTQHCRIVYLMSAFEFPWDMTRALELALLRTFCAPRISRLLDATGEFRVRGQRRYDDTALLMAEMIRWGYDSPRGRMAIERMNQIHSRFRIANEDYLYVLSTFVLEPIRWIDAYGRRSLVHSERHGLFYFFRAVGQRMGLCDLPDSLAQMERMSRDYEQRYFVPAASNRRVVDAAIRMIEKWLPPGTRWLVRPTVCTLMDEPMRQAFELRAPPAWWDRTVRKALATRARVLALLPVQRRADFSQMDRTRTYPEGYTIEALGPPL